MQVSNDVSSETTGLGEIELIPGDLVDVKIISSTAGALKGEVVGLRTVRSLAQLKEKRTEGTAAE